MVSWWFSFLIKEDAMQKQRFEGSGLLLPSISVGLLSSWGVNF